MGKAYKLGIIVGRFQTFHNGHREMLDKAIELCEEVGVFIGSSQESGTNKNPFSYELRESILRRVYGDRIGIYPLPDIGVGNNCKWGEYVLGQVVSRYGRAPDVVISGKEERRIDWFDGVGFPAIAELYVPKEIDISASGMREMLMKGEREAWESFTPPELKDMFPLLRDEVVSSYKNKKTSSI